MERLYAVPSEQLRVWLVWLSKVGDMADEWHKWLRSHIDFVLRLSIELRAAEEVLTLEVRFRPSDQYFSIANFHHGYNEKRWLREEDGIYFCLGN